MTERVPSGGVRWLCPVCGPGAVHYKTQSQAETALVRHKRERRHYADVSTQRVPQRTRGR